MVQSCNTHFSKIIKNKYFLAQFLKRSMYFPEFFTNPNSDMFVRAKKCHYLSLCHYLEANSINENSEALALCPLKPPFEPPLLVLAPLSEENIKIVFSQYPWRL